MRVGGRFILLTGQRILSAQKSVWLFKTKITVLVGAKIEAFCNSAGYKQGFKVGQSMRQRK